MTNGTIRLETEEAVAWIRLDRPEHMNAMSPDLVEDLGEALDTIERENVARVIVITGEGRAFSAGGDLMAFQKRILDGDQLALAATLRRMREILRRIETSPRPVIAAVNGITIAGGLELVLCCDLVLAAESAKIGDGHLKFGVVPGAGSSVRLPRKLPRNIANRLLLTGELVSARQMLDWGLVNEVVPDAELVATARAWAGRIAKLSPVGLASIKHMIDTGLDQPLDTALRTEIAAFEAYSHAEDFLEGLTAFAEKREPRFTGR